MDVAHNLDLAGGLVVDTHGDFDFNLPVLHRVGADTVIPAVNGLWGAVRIRFRSGKCGVLGGGNTGFSSKLRLPEALPMATCTRIGSFFNWVMLHFTAWVKGRFQLSRSATTRSYSKLPFFCLWGEHIQVIGVQLLPGGPVNTTDQSHHQLFLLSPFRSV